MQAEEVGKIKKQRGRFFVIAISCALSFTLLAFPGGIIRGYVYGGLDIGVSMLSYLVVEYWLLKKYPNYKVTITVSFVLTLVAVYSWTCYRIGGFHTFILPNFVSFVLGCLFGYWFFVTPIRRVKIALLAVSLCIGVFYYFWGINYWLNYLNFGTFTGRVKEKAYPDWVSYIEPSGNGISVNSKNDLVLLDFFNTRCGICFRLFPVVQKTYDKYKTNKHISIYAVDIPFPEDAPGMAIQLVLDRGYTFPVLIGKKGLDSLFKIEGYPTTFILKGDSIIFRGSIEDVNVILEEQLHVFQK